MNKSEIAEQMYDDFINLNSQEKAFVLMAIIENFFGCIGGDGFHYWFINTIIQADNEILEEFIKDMEKRGDI